MSQPIRKIINAATTEIEVSHVAKPRSVAAVCIVWKNKSKKEIVLIKRRIDHPHQLSGQWFLPGGRVEDEEQPIVAALREAREECGIVAVRPSLVDLYAFTEHWSDNARSYSQPIVLSVYQAYYQSGALVPDECTDAQWIPKKNLRKFMSATTIHSHLSPLVRKLLGIK